MGRFTADDASAVRIITFCKVLQDLDKDVLVISLDKVLKYNEVNHHKGFKYFSLRSTSDSFFARILNYFLHTVRLKRIIAKLDKDYEIEGIFFYDVYPSSLFYLKKYVKLNDLSIFHDSVEWYSPEQFKWGRLSLPYIFKNLLNKYFIDKQISVFSISSYLHNYFISKGIRSTKIPIMLDMNEISFEKKIVPDKLCLVYAGSPGKKDYLKEIVEGLARLENDKLKDIELQLLGATKEQLKRVCKISDKTIEKLGNSLVARGRVSRDEVLNQLQRADFTVLLRSSELRYAKAGFPTKVVESLATGTPVICNITSDLGDYLIDSENSLIVETCSAEAFEIVLRKALALTFEEKQTLCENARKTAELKFDYKMFKEQFNKFLCEKL